MRQTPTATPGTTKYGATGGLNADQLRDLQLPEATLASLAQLGNFGITSSTWSSYKTAQNAQRMSEAHRS